MGMADLGSRAIIGRIFLALESAELPAWTSSISMLINSDQESETYRWLTQIPALREWVGGRNAARLETFEQIVRNKRYEATLEVSREELRRDKTDQIQLRINELATRASQHWAKLLTDTIVGGATTTCYDGQFFFDTDHSEGDSGTQSNKLTYNGAATPTAADLEGSIFEMLEAMHGFKDHAGEPMNEGLSEMTIMVPVARFGAANRALNDGVITDGSGTRTNTLVNLGGYNFQLVVNPRLTDPAVIYGFRSDSVIKPYIAQTELQPSIEALAEGSDFAFNNDAHQYGISKSCAAGQAIWQHAVMTTFDLA